MTAAKALPTGCRFRLPLRQTAGRIDRWSGPVLITRVRLNKDEPADRVVAFEGGYVSLPADAPCAHACDSEGA